jgi:hypothetical protein
VDQKAVAQERMLQDTLLYLISRGVAVPNGMYVTRVDLVSKGEYAGSWMYELTGPLSKVEYDALVADTPGFKVVGEWVGRWGTVLVYELA